MAALLLVPLVVQLVPLVPLLLVLGRSGLGPVAVCSRRVSLPVVVPQRRRLLRSSHPRCRARSRGLGRRRVV